MDVHICVNAPTGQIDPSRPLVVCARVLGLGGIAIASVEIAKIIFVVALILFLISVVVGFARRGSAPMP